MTAHRLSLLLPACTLLLSACVSTPGPQVKGSGRCDASALGWAVGQPANEANMRRLSSESGAGLVNPIGPTTITTKDIRPDRLRVYMDKDNIITAARCE
ncbi:I78 family peptidase inhibitor [Stenotrophomonas sp.]|uniref:I78 family peptidase inhibitor n=1 Tax=Stenotrophomonas sp. TaxID=69392 RepID=UPI002D6C65EE|nr:I78 family peptidase inhibitor [Stenotrophomonas sp.]HYQ21814.1 I78 family peptidase inhibitor [Stenotrophomonas sp.]